jgi:altronate dehydratase large subunit
MKEYFYGYERDNGFGIRNHILVIPTVTCSEFVAQKIVEKSSKYYHSADGKVKLLRNPYGCAQAGKDLEQTTRTIINAGLNPNVKSGLIVSLGCESIDFEKITDEISKKKEVYHIKVQEHDFKKSIEIGIDLIKKLSENAINDKRKKTGIENIVIGSQQGGSDYTSGLVSNPLVGKVSDWIVSNGGTSIIGEVPELIGAEHLYAKRAINGHVKKQILNAVKDFEEKLKREAKVDFIKAQPSPGNIAGGYTTIEEKSLDAIKRSGSMPVSGVVDYAEIVKGKGHYLMNTPGYDVESISGQVAGGANLILFTTGLGTPTGNAIAPVIRITSNSETYRIMNDIIDYDASDVLLGKKKIEESVVGLKKLIIDVANGKNTKSELNHQDDFSIYRIGPTF